MYIIRKDCFGNGQRVVGARNTVSNMNSKNAIEQREEKDGKKEGKGERKKAWKAKDARKVK